jgi:glucans biosynthesis protein
MKRRDFFAAAGAGVLGAGAAATALGEEAAVPQGPKPGEYAAVVARARELSKAPFEPAVVEPAGPFAELDLERYRAIRPRTIPIGSERSGFAVDLLPPGFIYKDPVAISLVTGGVAQDIPFSPSLFDFDPAIFDANAVANAAPAAGLAFSGFRLRHRLNRVDQMDEFAVFQGASYFRLIARNMIYGLAGRGLAIGTGDAKGEEFPAFRHFWIEQPAPGARSIVVRALLDSRSCTGAFEFDISPGETTSMQTRCTLFPREALDKVGIAPLTSMYLFGPQWRPGVDDFRNAAHNSEGLQMVTGRAERLWRPLTNPRQVQISAFQDAGPKAFGLSQRRREFSHFEDDKARYGKRPTGWVEPVDDWGQGAVVLVEIPTEYEFNDNVVAFWRPGTPLGPTEEGHRFAYCLNWCATPPDDIPLSRVHATRSGRSVVDEARRVMAVDFTPGARWSAPPKVEATISQGEITGLVLRDLPDGMTRAVFEFSPGEAELVELQLVLVGQEGPVSERWIYRWTPA